jgi:hypothetical protein
MKAYSTVFFFLGMLICLLSVVTATILYNSFGYTFTERTVYSIFGFILAITGIVLLTASGILAQKSSYLLSFIAFLGWLLAVAIAITSHIGFMATAQLHSQQNSETAVANKQRISELNSQIEASAGVLAIDVSQLKARLAQKQSELTDAQQAVANCPKNYVSVCIRPGQAKVASIQKQITQLEGQLSEVSRVEGLQNIRNSLSGNGTVTSLDEMPAHVLFHMLGHYFGVKAQIVMSWFLLISATFLEFLGSFFLLLSRKFNEPETVAMPNGFNTIQPTQQVEQPQLTTKEELSLPTQWQYPSLGSFVKKA